MIARATQGVGRRGVCQPAEVVTRRFEQRHHNQRSRRRLNAHALPESVKQPPISVTTILINMGNVRSHARREALKQTRRERLAKKPAVQLDGSTTPAGCQIFNVLGRPLRFNYLLFSIVVDFISQWWVEKKSKLFIFPDFFFFFLPHAILTRHVFMGPH